MSVLSLYASHDFEGMTLTEAATLLGHPRDQVKNWLGDRGFRVPRGGIRLRRAKPAHEIQDEINARIQAMRPIEPCFRCGVREGCRHR